MGLVETLYGEEDISLRDVWNHFPFRLFSPEASFLGFRHVVRAISSGDNSFFVSNIRNNFLPLEKSEQEILELKRNAINRGIKALNDLARTHLPEYYAQLGIPEVASPYNPLTTFAEAREKWKVIKNWKELKAPPEHMAEARRRWIESGSKTRKPIDPKERLEVYNTVRSWGLGHFILIIDESPEIFNSVHYEAAIESWLENQFQFEIEKKMDDERFPEGTFLWSTSAGVNVISDEQGYRHRAKVIGEDGQPRYSSLLMKMFSKRGFLDKVNDTYGVEVVVESGKDAVTLIDYIRYNIKGSSNLEKFESVEGIPPFECYKFLLRVPIRVVTESPAIISRYEPQATVKSPLERVIRVSIEFQIRTLHQDYDHETNHKAYKKQQYMKVFPLWYPRDIYEPLLKDIE